MTRSICGIDCTKCELGRGCRGCASTGGRPFGAECVVALCLKDGENALYACKKDLIAAFHALPLEELKALAGLHALKGSFINLEYSLPGGQRVKFWDDRKIYLGNQLCQKGGGYYGLIADEKYLMVSQYRGCGSDAEVLVFQRWR